MVEQVVLDLDVRLEDRRIFKFVLVSLIENVDVGFYKLELCILKVRVFQTLG